MAKRDYGETRLQIAAMDYLLGQVTHRNKTYPVKKPFPELIFTFVPNKAKSAAEGYKFKRMGVRAGMWDIPCWWSGNPGKGILEAKYGNGKLSPEQIIFEREFKASGGVSGQFRTVAELRDILISWGLTCHNTAVHEPAPSFKERSKMSIDFFRPEDVIV